LLVTRWSFRPDLSPPFLPAVLFSAKTQNECERRKRS
jgi:hypothetical protein